MNVAISFLVTETNILPLSLLPHTHMHTHTQHCDTRPMEVILSSQHKASTGGDARLCAAT